jgi:uncharacterized protein YfeS
MILTLLGYNNGTTTRHIGVRPIFRSHPNMSCCYTVVVYLECFDNFSFIGENSEKDVSVLKKI